MARVLLRRQGRIGPRGGARPGQAVDPGTGEPAARPGCPGSRGRLLEAGRGVEADPDLREPRPPGRPDRPAGEDGAPDAARARARLPRPDGSRPRRRVLHRQPHPRRAGAHDVARHHRAAQAHLHGPDRRRVCTRVGGRGTPLAAGPLPGRPPAPPFLGRREAKPAVATHRRGGPGALPAHQVRGPEALFPRGRRFPDPAARRSRPAVRHQRRGGDRHRHGASRAPQRAGERARQVAVRPVPATSSTTRVSRPT